MNFLVAGALSLITLIGYNHGQPPKNCLLEDGPARLSGLVAYDSWRHPNPEMGIVDGYKIILLKPTCFAYTSLNDNLGYDTMITEVQVLNVERPFLKRNVGKLITVTGTFRTRLTYVITWPQIEASSFTRCEVAPKTKGVEKC